MIDVTVLIRCYKQEQYLYDCIRRLGDVPYMILSDYPQRGKRARLNEAAYQVDTEYIAFNDADDMSIEGRFNKNFISDVIYSDYYELSRAGVRLVKSREFDGELLKQENYIPFSTIIVKTELLRQVSFAIDYRGNFEDWLWLNDVAKVTDRFFYNPIPTMIYRKSEYPYGKIPVIRRLNRMYQENQVRKIINARTQVISD